MAANRLYLKRLPAVTEQLKGIRNAVKTAAQQLHCSETTQQQIMLAVNEACCNIIRHAYHGTPGDIVLEIWHEQNQMVLKIRDFAAPIDLHRLQSRALSDVRPGGLGLYFMRRVMDEVRFLNCSDGGNVVELRKTIG